MDSVERTVRILLVSGSLRDRSTSTAALRTAARIAPSGIEAIIYEGLAELPAFNPDDDGDRLPAAASALRAAIRDADAVVLSTPEYAGALPGSFKNLLDWTIGDDQPGSIYQKPVAWINVAPSGAVDAHDSLRKVLSYAMADVVTPGCLNVPISHSMVNATGVVSDLDARAILVAALQAIADHVRRRRSG